MLHIFRTPFPKNTSGRLILDEYETYLNLKSNKNIIIQKADKGNSFVVFKTYSKNQDKRHFLDMELEIKSCSDDLFDKNYLSNNDHKYLKPCGSKPDIMYGLCKIHKGATVNDLLPSFRPILSAIGTCSYKLANIFVQILKKFTINSFMMEAVVI